MQVENICPLNPKTHKKCKMLKQGEDAVSGTSQVLAK